MIGLNLIFLQAMNIHIFQHVPFEGPGCIIDWINENGHTVSFTHWYERPQKPDLSNTDFLIIMGGPMSVHDRTAHTWLAAEQACIQQMLRGNKKILGICLGAQLLANSLGAAVYPNTEKEIGWLPLQFDNNIAPTLLPVQATVFHWHGDTFDLPKNAVRFASTPVTPNQAFMYGDRVIGLQFHLEVNRPLLHDMLRHGLHELVAAPHIQDPATITAGQHFIPETNKLMYALLDYIAGV
jgi:GMP synthase-like glutamine amidotransferase